MEGSFMNGLWKKRVPAFLLTLVMIVSLMPAASAELNSIYGADSEVHWLLSPVDGNDQRTKHTFTDVSITKEATCNTAGEKTVICTVCGYEGTVSIPATGVHPFGKWEKLSDSQHQRVCSVCQAKETLPHDYGTDSAQPVADGTNHTRVCKDCLFVLTEKHTHAAGDIGTRSVTCETSGATTYTCSLCGATYMAQEKLDHIDQNSDGVCDRCGQRIAVGYTVTFNTNGGSAVASQTVPVGGTLPTKLTGDPTKSGCVFKGWTTTPSSLYVGQSMLLSTSTVNTQPISADTTFYAVWQVKVTGQSGAISAASNIGSTLWSHIAGKCSPYFGGNPASVTFGAPLPTSAYGTLYLSGTTPVQAGIPYNAASFGAMMNFQPGSSGAVYQLYYTATDTSGQNTVSGSVNISAQTTGSTISLSVAPGKIKYFESNDFQNALRLAGYTTSTVSYVTFPNVSGNYANFSGRVYSGSTELTAATLGGGSYAYTQGINGLSLRASSSAKSDSFTTTYRIYASSGAMIEGILELKVTGASRGDVTYNVDPGREVSFDARDFNRAFQDKYGSASYTLNYVTFSAPTSYTSFRGTLYVDSTSFTRNGLNSSFFFYDSRSVSGRNNYALDRMSFRADSNARDGDKLTIPFWAYYGNGNGNYVECNLIITIGKGGASGDINYDVAPGKTVAFRQRDFRDFYEGNTTGTFDYVEFDQPSASAFDNGTLYHNYGTSSSKSFSRTTLDDQRFFSNPNSSQYGIGSLTFAASNNFKEVITLTFTAYGSGRSVSGTVTVASTESASDGDITYTVAPGKSVDFKRTDFNTYFRKRYNTTVSYVVFERPDGAIFNNGTFYCDYGTSTQTTFGRNELGGARFYYDKNSMGRSDYYLDELTFVAGSGFRDSFTLNFVAYGTQNGEYVEGTVFVKADTAAAISSNYTGSVRYATTTGTNVQINANDIARYFKQVYPAYTLQYVTLTGVPAIGGLYYNYYNASSYGITSRTQVTAANCAGLAFYLSPTATTQYALTELTYVPSGTGYCATIPFTAYGTGGVSVTGGILISVSRSAVSEVYGITPRNTAVSFPAGSIYSAVLTATGSSLSGIQLLALPAATSGTVYVGTGVDRADTRTVYTYAAGTNSMSALRFVPTAAFTGSVEIPYVALDANGTALASGTFSLGVLNNRKTLKDINSSTWCYKYVMELTDQNVISGYNDGSFKPNSTVTYGAALKLIMLAAGYPEQAPTGKNVFSGYLAKAQADGIITRSNVNLAAPITRLQVAQIAAGALKLSTSNLSSVKPFTDTSDVYVQALNAAGIVEGYFSNGTSTYRPSSTLNRGQMSAIVWRMNQYRK